MFEKMKEKRRKKKLEKIRAQKIALITSALFLSVIVLACIIGSANEREKTNFSTDDYVSALSDSTFNDVSSAGLPESKTSEPIKLETTDKSLSLAVGEKYDYASFYNYSADVDLKAHKLEAVSSDETVAKVEIKEIDEDEVALIISGVSKGRADIAVKSSDGIITSEMINAVISYGEDTLILASESSNVSIRVNEQNADCSLFIDDLLVDLTDYEFDVNSTDEDVAKAEIKEVDSQNITLLITGISPGKTDISVVSNDGEIASDDIHVTVKKAPKSETSKSTTKKEVLTTEEKTTDEGERAVYITPSGNCYHAGYCRYLKGNGSAVTIREAKARGLRPCAVCCP